MHMPTHARQCDGDPTHSSVLQCNRKHGTLCLDVHTPNLIIQKGGFDWQLLFHGTGINTIMWAMEDFAEAGELEGVDVAGLGKGQV